MSNQPAPIQLNNQAQLFEVGQAMEEQIYLLQKRIRLYGVQPECDTIETFVGRLAAAKAAYEIIRRAAL